MGPAETMTPFRDFGTETLPVEKINASKELHECNWLQSFDGDLDGAHVSWLHSYFAMADIPDDGTDVPGAYPSGMMTHRIWWHDRAPILEVEDRWFGFHYAALRDTPNGNTHVRTYAYVMPSTSILSGTPLNTRQIMIVPRDDETNYRYSFETQVIHNPHDYGKPTTSSFTEYPYTMGSPTAWTGMPKGVVEHPTEPADNYGMDRLAQKTVSMTGIPDFRGHDRMATSSMGLGKGDAYDRTKEHWGTTDVALIRMHTLILDAAQDVAAGKQPPAVSDDLDYRSIRGAEKILSRARIGGFSGPTMTRLFKKRRASRLSKPRQFCAWLYQDLASCSAARISRTSQQTEFFGICELIGGQSADAHPRGERNPDAVWARYAGGESAPPLLDARVALRRDSRRRIASR